MTDRLFIGGPRHGQQEPCMTSTPTPVVPQLRESPSDLMCADEQVIEYIGRYVRSDLVEGVWRYEWQPRSPDEY